MSDRAISIACPFCVSVLSREGMILMSCWRFRMLLFQLDCSAAASFSAEAAQKPFATRSAKLEQAEFKHLASESDLDDFSLP